MKLLFLFFFSPCDEKVTRVLTFTVDHVGVEFETDLAETQEGAVGVDALAVEADVVFAALVHFCSEERKRKGRNRRGVRSGITI